MVRHSHGHRHNHGHVPVRQHHFGVMIISSIRPACPPARRLLLLQLSSLFILFSLPFGMIPFLDILGAGGSVPFFLVVG